MNFRRQSLVCTVPKNKSLATVVSTKSNYQILYYQQYQLWCWKGPQKVALLGSKQFLSSALLVQAIMYTTTRINLRILSPGTFTYLVITTHTPPAAFPCTCCSEIRIVSGNKKIKKERERERHPPALPFN